MKNNNLKNTTNHLHIPIETTPSIIKEGISNHSREELNENKVKLLNLGSKFLPTENRKRPYMDIIQTKQICALDIEREVKLSVGESSLQNTSRIITKDLKKKHKNNLRFAKKKG